MKINSILVPVDFSDLSILALKRAAEFAKINDSVITPFHAYIPVADVDGLYYMGMGLGANTTYNDIEPAITERLNAVAEEHVPKEILRPGVVGMGNPAHSITEEGKKYDLIAMSTHGRTGFTRFILGSVAEKVLRMSHTPVLVIEDASVLVPLKRILLTTDFSENSLAAFPYAAEIAEKTGALVDLVHIIKYDEFKNMSTAQTFASLRKERLEKLIEEYFKGKSVKVKSEVVLTSESPHESIFNLHFSRSYNLVVMSTIGRTGLEYLTMGSTTANVARLVDAPILSINPSDSFKTNQDQSEDSE